VRAITLTRPRPPARQQAWRLTNKCSRCQCIGHNKQNHTGAFDTFLAAHGLLDAGSTTAEIIDGYKDNKTEVDGVYEWMQKAVGW
jgi:hypothetical protein